MVATSNPLQGSLFGDIDENQNKVQSPREAIERKNDLSEESLKKDALLRPRISKSKKPDIENELFEGNKKASLSKPDLPNWSNHQLVPENQLTPVLRHYVELKKSNPERILLYRLGDFFECFFEDAIKLSQLLELTLTGKDGGKTIGRVPMAGIPHHASERYCSEIIKKGFSVAICDQLESKPSKEGALLRRGITRVITPGTVIEEGMLQARRNNWLVSVLIENLDPKTFKWATASADVSTGEFIIRIGKEINSLTQELLKQEASEIISQPNSIQSQLWCPNHISITEIDKTSFTLVEAETALKKHYDLMTIAGLGLQSLPLAIRTAGGLVAYLDKTNPKSGENEKGSTRIKLDLPVLNQSKDKLIIDSQTRRNLELTTTQRDGQFQGSVLWAIDRTLTSMGGRCLRRWVEEPLIDIKSIRSRQEIIGALIENAPLRRNLRKGLRAIADLERLAGRAAAQQASARDLVAIAEGIDRLPFISSYLQKLPEQHIDCLKDILHIDQKLIDISSLVLNQIVINPPLSLTEGGLINDGFDHLLDGLRNQMDDQTNWLKNQEELERRQSKIVNLKLQYHRTFGYFLAVTKSKLENVPKHWIRRQTLANEERFITPDLKEREGKIFQIKARSSQREYELFCDLRDKVGNESEGIRLISKAISKLDSLCGLAELAATNSYTKPKIVGDQDNQSNRELIIIDGRHPVVEQMLANKLFTANDIKLGNDTDLIILSGPNASGKSCYLRQIGLLQIMAQMGGWIPAKEATISIADQVFTRVGAVDDLAAGQSTFMVEMTETAFILNQATERSLVLLDEIGRGTSTFDGLSIAWSVSEFLANTIRSRTIFATHYHELNKISTKLTNVKNYQVLVAKKDNELKFLHKVVQGGSSKSYGIEAARLAGIPKNVIKNAETILKSLETKSSTKNMQNLDPINPSNVDDAA